MDEYNKTMIEYLSDRALKQDDAIKKLQSYINKQKELINKLEERIEILEEIDKNNQTIIENLEKASGIKDEIIKIQKSEIDELRS